MTIAKNKKDITKLFGYLLETSKAVYKRHAQWAGLKYMDNNGKEVTKEEVELATTILNRITNAI